MPGLRPAQANLWCPAKKNHTCCKLLCGRGIEVETPAPSAADCCVVGELRLKPPPPKKRHRHCRVLRVLRVACDSAFGLHVAHSACVARSRRCLRYCLWSLIVRVPCYADTPLFENAISHECLFPLQNCAASIMHGVRPGQTQLVGYTEDEVWDHMLAPIQELNGHPSERRTSPT